ncbi:MAG: radical SAM protein [Desulfuromonadaceae bacterium]
MRSRATTIPRAESDQAGGDRANLHSRQTSQLTCVMPWKALCMDESQGRIVALPCCLSWIRHDYGTVGIGPLHELWNSDGAQFIRERIATGHQNEVCDRNCPFLISGSYGESALRIVDGSAEFVANQKLNLQEIAERRVVLRSKPMLVKVMPSLQCNLDCTMCFQEHGRDAEMSKQDWQDVEQLLPFVRELTFQGGEATLNPQFRKFLGTLSSQLYPQLRISLITNGTVFDKPLTHMLSRLLLNSVIVSLNAATRVTYAGIAGKDLFARVMENLRGWIDLSRNHPLGRFELFLSFVVMRSNFHELTQFLQLSERLGVPVQLLPVIGDRNGEDLFVRDDKHRELELVLDEAGAIASAEAGVQVERIRDILRGYQNVS